VRLYLIRPGYPGKTRFYQVVPGYSRLGHVMSV
jgi:hypothetical protein